MNHDLWQYNYATPRVMCRLYMIEGITLYKFLVCIKNDQIGIDHYNKKISSREWYYLHDIEQGLANEIAYQVAFNG